MLTNPSCRNIVEAEDSSSPANDFRQSDFDASALWTAIRAGRARIIASYCTRSACHLEIQQTAHDTPLSEREVGILQRLLLGDSQKVIAIDTSRASSTIALCASRALGQIGVGCSPSSIPTALVMVAHAALGLLSDPLHARLWPMEGNPLRLLLSIRRPNTDLPGLLSPAERAVVDMLVEARGRTEMSSLRRCSKRTIANQIAQVYKKLRISGRVPLIIRLLQRDLREALRAMTIADNQRSVLVHLGSGKTVIPE